MFYCNNEPLTQAHVGGGNRSFGLSATEKGAARGSGTPGLCSQRSSVSFLTATNGSVPSCVGMIWRR